MLIATATATVTLAGVFTLAGLLGFTRPTAPASAPSSTVPAATAEDEALVLMQPSREDPAWDDDDEEEEHREAKHHGRNHHEHREHDHDD